MTRRRFLIAGALLAGFFALPGEPMVGAVVYGVTAYAIDAMVTPQPLAPTQEPTPTAQPTRKTKHQDRRSR